MANGDCLLLENIGESVDPVLDTLLGRLTIKRGRYIKIGDKEIEFHPKFRLILQVRRENYTDDLCLDNNNNNYISLF